MSSFLLSKHQNFRYEKTAITQRYILVEKACRLFKGDVTQDDSQRRLSSQVDAW